MSNKKRMPTPPAESPAVNDTAEAPIPEEFFPTPSPLPDPVMKPFTLAYKDAMLGYHYLRHISELDTPLDNFVRTNTKTLRPLLEEYEKGRAKIVARYQKWDNKGNALYYDTEKTKPFFGPAETEDALDKLGKLADETITVDLYAFPHNAFAGYNLHPSAISELRNIDIIE